MDFSLGATTVEIHDPLTNALLLVVLMLCTVAAYMGMVHFRGKRATHFGNLRTLQRVHGFRRFYLSPAVLIFKIAVICLLFLAATETIELRQSQPIVDTDYLLLIDSSPSMAKTDYEPNRLAAAKTIALEWLSILPNSTRVGYISFAQTIQTLVDPTTNKGVVQAAIENTDIDYAQSGTSLDLALNRGFDLFDDSNLKRTVLLFTDGTGDVQELTLARANGLGVRIYVFGIGSVEELAIPDDIPEDFRDLYVGLEMNFSRLASVATATNGLAYQIQSIDELDESFRDVTLEDVQIKLNTTYYIVILISLLSILELIVYSKLGGL